MYTMTPKEVFDLLDKIYPDADARDAAVALVVSLLVAGEAANDDAGVFLDDVRESFEALRAGAPARTASGEN